MFLLLAEFLNKYDMFNFVQTASVEVFAKLV